jgi:hypothetical protein
VVVKNSNLVIIPTRSRPANAERAVRSIQKHSRISDIVLGLDTDDEHNYPRLDGVMYEVGDRSMMIGTLNKIANKYAGDYDFITFLGDDNIINTDKWDVILSNTLRIVGGGLTYGDDLLQGKKLPTSVMMSSEIIRCLGYMVPPTFTHLWADNFWRKLGDRLNRLYYNPKVNWEHLHYVNKKAEKDELYAEVNSDEMYKKDREAYLTYCIEQLDSDIEKLQKELQW